MARKYPTPRKWTPTNPHKYMGDANNIVARSSWEIRVMIKFDSTPSVLKWSSEEIFIPYISPVDNRPHRYFVDFIIEYKTSDGTIKRAAIEVKPEAQTMAPKNPKRMTKQFVESVETYAINTAKWEAAKKWCAKQGMDFIILTERALGLVGKK